MRDLRQTGYAQQVGSAPAFGGHRVVFVFLLELTTMRACMRLGVRAF